MTDTEGRILEIAANAFGPETELDLDQRVADLGFSSLDVVSFLDLVAEEFSPRKNLRDYVGADTLRQLAALVDSDKS